SLCQRLVGEARADMRGIAKLAAVPITDEQRTQRRACTFALRVAADHEVRGVRRLDLEPRARALAGLVAAVLALADHAFQAARLRGGQQLDAVLRRMHE